MFRKKKNIQKKKKIVGHVQDAHSISLELQQQQQPPSDSGEPAKLKPVLNGSGYHIPIPLEVLGHVENTNIETLNHIKNDLMVSPVCPGAPVPINKHYPIYRQLQHEIIVPRYYGLANIDPHPEFRWPEDSKIRVPFPENMQFHGTLKPHQQEAVDAYKRKIDMERGGGGLFELSCGKGKTVIGIYIICFLLLRGIVFVSNTGLVIQWMERFKQYAPGIRIGIIGGKYGKKRSEIQVEDYDVVICMIQSIMKNDDFPTSFFNSFGVLVVDEVHFISSEVFSRSLFKCIPKFVVGLSATMDRKDLTSWAFKLFLGDVVYRNIDQDDREVDVRAIFFNADDEEDVDEFIEPILSPTGTVAYTPMIQKLAAYGPRNNFIKRFIPYILCIEDGHRQTIFFSITIDLLIQFRTRVLEEFPELEDDFGLYVSKGTKEKDRPEALTKQFILTNYSMGSTGLDVPSLSTLVFLLPRTDIRQTVGRILRGGSCYKPIVFEIIDPQDVFRRQWMKRNQYYQSQKYNVTYTNSRTFLQKTEKCVEQCKRKLDRSTPLSPSSSIFSSFVNPSFEPEQQQWTEEDDTDLWKQKKKKQKVEGSGRGESIGIAKCRIQTVRKREVD